MLFKSIWFLILIFGIYFNIKYSKFQGQTKYLNQTLRTRSTFEHHRLPRCFHESWRSLLSVHGTNRRSLARSRRAGSRSPFSLIWPSFADQNHQQRQWLRRCALQSSRVAGRTRVSPTATGALAATTAALRHRWTSNLFSLVRLPPEPSRRPCFAPAAVSSAAKRACYQPRQKPRSQASFSWFWLSVPEMGLSRSLGAK